MTSQEHEREIKHIATGTNPQPRGWTTRSLLIVVAVGMMKMATSDDFPLRRSARTGSILVFRIGALVRRRYGNKSIVMIVDIDFCNRNNKKQQGSN